MKMETELASETSEKERFVS